MALVDVVAVVLVLLPSAIVTGTYVVSRSRLREELPRTAFEAVRAAWVASAVALLVGSLLGWYAYAVTVGELASTWSVGRPQFGDFLAAYRVASWSILCGVGLFLLGVAVLLVAGLRRRLAG